MGEVLQGISWQCGQAGWGFMPRALVKCTSYSKVLLNSYSDLTSLLARLRVEFPGLGMLVLSFPFVSGCPQGYFSLWLLVIPPVGWGRDKSPSRKPKMLEKLVVYLQITFSSVETMSQEDIFRVLNPQNIRRLWGGASWMWKFNSFIICSEFFHFHVAVGAVSFSYSSSRLLLVMILVLYICFLFSVEQEWS